MLIPTSPVVARSTHAQAMLQHGSPQNEQTEQPEVAEEQSKTAGDRVHLPLVEQIAPDFQQRLETLQRQHQDEVSEF